MLGGLSGIPLTITCEQPLPLSQGEVAERSEDGEGKIEACRKAPLSHLR